MDEAIHVGIVAIDDAIDSVVSLADLVKEVRDACRAVVVHSRKYAGSVLGTDLFSLGAAGCEHAP